MSFKSLLIQIISAVLSNSFHLHAYAFYDMYNTIYYLHQDHILHIYIYSTYILP